MKPAELLDQVLAAPSREAQLRILRDALRGAARELGGRGGRARKRRLSPEELSEIGRKGGLAGGRGRPSRGA